MLLVGNGQPSARQVDDQEVMLDTGRQGGQEQEQDRTGTRNKDFIIFLDRETCQLFQHIQPVTMSELSDVSTFKKV